jgi:4-hydroxy-3-polyprenylbenzoate decarboxylase
LGNADALGSRDLDRHHPQRLVDPARSAHRARAQGQGRLHQQPRIIDACRPWHWRDKFPKVNAPSPEEARLARQKFGYLLK